MASGVWSTRWLLWWSVAWCVARADEKVFVLAVFEVAGLSRGSGYDAADFVAFISWKLEERKPMASWPK